MLGKLHCSSAARSLGVSPPPPPRSPPAEGLLASAAGCLIAGSGERQRSASRLEAPAPPPSRCRHRNHPVRHHMQRYLRPCDITPIGSTSASGLFLTYAYAFQDCGSVGSAPAFAGSGDVNRPKAEP